MNPIQPENIPEQKKEQQQQTVTHQAIDKKEEAPTIKSEENQENWKKFREQRELERKQKEESDRRATEKAAEAEALKAALEALTNKPVRRSNNDYDDNEEETEEQRIDKRVRAIIDEKEKQYEKEYQQRELKEYPQRLIQTYPDYNNVVSKENLDYIDYHYPELGAPFKYMPDGFDKAAALYKLVKKFVPITDSKKEQKKVENNLQKPGSVSSAGPSHGGNSTPAYKLTEERKAANYERMQRTIKGLS